MIRLVDKEVLNKIDGIIHETGKNVGGQQR
jgi:hypothetical protein